MMQIYGVHLVELDEGVKHLMVVNAIESGDPPINWKDDDRKHQAILLPILAFVFMNGGAAGESKYMKFHNSRLFNLFICL